MLNNRPNNNNNNNNQAPPPEEPPAPPMEEEADDENEEEHIPAGDRELVQPEEPPVPQIEQQIVEENPIEQEAQQQAEEPPIPPQEQPEEQINIEAQPQQNGPPERPIEEEDIIDLAADDENEEQPRPLINEESDSDGPLENIVRNQMIQQDPIEQEPEELPPLEQRIRQIIEQQQEPINQEAEELPPLEQREIYVPQEDLNQIPLNIQQEIPPIDEIDIAVEDIDADHIEEEEMMDPMEQINPIEEEEQADDENEEDMMDPMEQIDPMEDEERRNREFINKNPRRGLTRHQRTSSWDNRRKNFERGWPNEKLRITESDEELFWDTQLIRMGIDIYEDEKTRYKEPKDVIMEMLQENNWTLPNNKEELPEDFTHEEIDDFIRDIERDIIEEEREIEEYQMIQQDPIEQQPIEIPDEEFSTSTNEPASLTEGGQHYNSKTAEKTKGRVKWYKVKPSDRLLRPFMKRDWKYSDDEKHVTERTKSNIKSQFRELNKKIDNLHTKIKEERRLTKKENKLIRDLKNLKEEVAKLPDISKSRRMKKLERKLQFIPTYNVC